MKEKVFSIGILIFFCMTLQATPLFYLSTEKSFTPKEQARVKLESGYHTTSIFIRVYQIKEPISFYRSQPDFHRIRMGKRDFRKDTSDITGGVFHYLKMGIRNWVRSNIDNQHRTKSLNVVPDLRGQVEDYIEVANIVKPLKDDNFHLAQEFTYNAALFNQDWNYNYILFHNLEKGLYLIEAIRKGQVAYTVLNISDFSFIVKKADKDLLVYTSHFENGKPIKNIKLSLFDKDKNPVKTLYTDKNGLAFASISQNDLFILAESKERNYSFYDPRFYPVTARDVYTYMYTDRPVYRGGDTVNFKGIIRRYSNDRYYVKTDPSISIEVVDSQGKVINKFNVSSRPTGSFDGHFVLPDDSVTGRYIIIADIDGKRFEAEFKVEYYQKPEFEVKVRPRKELYIAGEKVKAEVSARYYFGEPLKEGRVQYSVYKTGFKDDEWVSEKDKEFYLSVEEMTYAQMELVDQGEERLDSRGRATLSFNTGKEDSPYYYKIQAVVIDETGVKISGSSRTRVVPADLKIRIRSDKFIYLKDDRINLDIAAEDYKGRPLKRKLKIRATSEIEPEQIHIFLDKEIETDIKGLAQVQFQADKNGFVKIEIRGEDKKGNETFTQKYLWIGEQGARYHYQGGLVKLVLDKRVYKVGDQAKLLILSPVQDIHFLFTLEGDTIYQYKVQEFSKNSALITFTVRDNFVPNIFASIGFIFNNQFYQNTIKIDAPAVNKFLKIKIDPVKEIYKPGASGQARIKVIDRQNRPVGGAELSVAVVDEALFGISEEIAVDIKKFFYPFRRNNVKSWASMAYRFYGYSKEAAEQLATSRYRDITGLAAFKGEEEMEERKEFKDSILWLPYIRTDSRGEALVDISFPDNITRWRITALGITEDTKVGKDKGHVITRLDFFARLLHSSFLNEKDKPYVYSAIHNNTSRDLTVRATMSAKNLSILKTKQTITVPAQTQKVLEWEILPVRIGEAEISLEVKAGQYSDKITKALTILPHSIMKTKNYNKILTRDSRIMFDKPQNMKEETLSMQIALSYGYYATVASALPYLIEYPWGCVEQTTSSFLPNLVAIKALQKYNIHLPRVEKELARIVSTGLERLYGFQNEDGGWGWFGGDRKDIFMTSYVLYALTLTRSLGYSVDTKVITRGLETLIQYVPDSQNVTETVFALYVLSLNNKNFPSMLEKVKKKELNDYDLALLSLTLHRYGMKNEAEEMIDRLVQKAKKVSDNDQLYWGVGSTEYWHRDSVETTAWAIKAINTVKGDSDTITPAIAFLLMNREGTHWKSTRDTAACIFAIVDVMEKYSFQEKNFDIVINNKKVSRITFSRNNLSSDVELSYSDLKDLEEKNSLVIEGLAGDDKLFASLSLSYYTKEKEIKPARSGMTVDRSYYELNQYSEEGKIRYELGGRISSIKKGENFVVRLDVTVDKPYQYVMLEDYYPAGCQPVKDFLTYNIDKGNDTKRADFIDYRDEKVAFFIDFIDKSASLYYVVTPIFKGEYSIVPGMGALMYFPAIRGNSSQIELKIH
ncbi:MAG: hypothetical protein JW827_12755 [Spirochaetes bacterium]|nr:hypothetical protein [Spirochaetota bacterium]